MNDRHRLPIVLGGYAARADREPEQDSAYRPTPESIRTSPQCSRTCGTFANGPQLYSSETNVNKNKYLIALIGLALGFIVSFFLTSEYNKSNAAPARTLRRQGWLAAQVEPAANRQ